MTERKLKKGRSEEDVAPYDEASTSYSTPQHARRPSYDLVSSPVKTGQDKGTLSPVSLDELLPPPPEYSVADPGASPLTIFRSLALIEAERARRRHRFWLQLLGAIGAFMLLLLGSAMLWRHFQQGEASLALSPAPAPTPVLFDASPLPASSAPAPVPPAQAAPPAPAVPAGTPAHLPLSFAPYSAWRQLRLPDDRPFSAVAVPAFGLDLPRLRLLVEPIFATERTVGPGPYVLSSPGGTLRVQHASFHHVDSALIGAVRDLAGWSAADEPHLLASTRLHLDAAALLPAGSTLRRALDAQKVGGSVGAIGAPPVPLHLLRVRICFELHKFKLRALSVPRTAGVLNPGEYLPALSSPLLSALAALPSGYDAGAYAAVVRRFGTHVLGGGSVGGYVDLHMRLDASRYLDYFLPGVYERAGFCVASQVQHVLAQRDAARPLPWTVPDICLPYLALTRAETVPAVPYTSPTLETDGPSAQCFLPPLNLVGSVALTSSHLTAERLSHYESQLSLDRGPWAPLLALVRELETAARQSPVLFDPCDSLRLSDAIAPSRLRLQDQARLAARLLPTLLPVVTLSDDDLDAWLRRHTTRELLDAIASHVNDLHLNLARAVDEALAGGGTSSIVSGTAAPSDPRDVELKLSELVWLPSTRLAAHWGHDASVLRHRRVQYLRDNLQVRDYYLRVERDAARGSYRVAHDLVAEPEVPYEAVDSGAALDPDVLLDWTRWPFHFPLELGTPSVGTPTLTQFADVMRFENERAVAYSVFANVTFEGARGQPVLSRFVPLGLWLGDAAGPLTEAPACWVPRAAEHVALPGGRQMRPLLSTRHVTRFASHPLARVHPLGLYTRGTRYLQPLNLARITGVFHPTERHLEALGALFDAKTRGDVAAADALLRDARLFTFAELSHSTQVDRLTLARNSLDHDADHGPTPLWNDTLFFRASDLFKRNDRAVRPGVPNFGPDSTAPLYLAFKTDRCLFFQHSLRPTQAPYFGARIEQLTFRQSEALLSSPATGLKLLEGGAGPDGLANSVLLFRQRFAFLHPAKQEPFLTRIYDKQVDGAGATA